MTFTVTPPTEQRPNQFTVWERADGGDPSEVCIVVASDTCGVHPAHRLDEAQRRAVWIASCLKFATETRRFPNGETITRAEATSEGRMWSQVMLYTEPAVVRHG